MKKGIWAVTVMVCLGQMLFAMANNAQGVLLTSYIDAFSLESGMQGLPNAAANIGVLVAMLLAVSIAARIGKPALYAGGLGLMALTLALAGGAPSFAWFIAAYVLVGFGFGSVDTTASSLIADLHEGRHASRLMGVLHAVYGLGGILIPILIAAGLGAGASWRAILYALAVAAGVLCVLCAVTFRRARDDMPARAAPPGKLSLAELALFAGGRGNLLLVLCAALYCAHQSTLFLWIDRIVSFGYGRPDLGAIALSVFWIGTVAARLVVPLLSVTTVRYLRWGMLLTGLSMLGGLLVGRAEAILASVALAGIFGGAMLPMSLTEATRRNPARSMLAITAVLLTTGIAAILCSPLAGFIIGRTSLVAGMVISAVFALACALCAFGLREHVPPERVEDEATKGAG